MAESAIVDEEPDFAPAPAYGRPMSIEEWDAMDEDAPGEIVDGRLEEEEVPDRPHEVILTALLVLLAAWARPRRGAVLASETKFALTKKRGRKPDLSVTFLPDRRLTRRGSLRTPPDIMIEIHSPRPRDRRRDRVQKLNEYATFGVRWYWLVDPEARTLEILRLGDDGHYVHALDAAEGTVDVPGCEGLRLDLDALWHELDDLIETDHDGGPSEGPPDPPEHDL
jgi:Uma2 family endonuclease